MTQNRHYQGWSSKNHAYDAYSNRVIRPNNNPDALGAVIDGLNLSVLPEGNELASRVNNRDQDPYFNTSTYDLTNGLMSDLNLNNLLFYLCGIKLDFSPDFYKIRSHLCSRYELEVYAFHL